MRAPCCTSPTRGQVQTVCNRTSLDGHSCQEGEKEQNVTPRFTDRKTRHEKIHCCIQDHTGNVGQSSQSPRAHAGIPVYGTESTGC